MAIMNRGQRQPGKPAPATQSPSERLAQRAAGNGKTATPAKAETPKAVEKKTATLTVQKTILEGGMVKGETVTAEEIEVGVFQTATANVGFSLSQTKNLGNFENVKMQVSVHMPCYVEEVDSALEQAFSKVVETLTAKVAELGIESAPEDGSEASGDPTDDLTGGEEASGDQAEGGEEGVNEDYILNADRETVVQLIAENQDSLGEIDPDQYPDDDELKQAVIQTLYAPAEGEEGAAEGGEEAAGEESQSYTREQLEAKEVTIDDLKAVFEEWQLGPFPKGPPAVARKNAINKILEAQGGE